MTSPLLPPTQSQESLNASTKHQPLDLSTLQILMRQMAHDMRGPLGVLTGTSEMFAQGVYGELTEQQARANERIQRNSYRLVALLDDLMAYVKAQADQFPLNTLSFEPRALLDELREQTTPLAESKRLTLQWAVSDDLPQTLVGDPPVIKRILLALLWNAIGYTDVGSVEVNTTWSSDNQWITIVRDSGPGIALGLLENLFMPFHYGKQRPKMPSSGFGLGLATASALARLMKGEIILEDNSTKGCSFSLLLPLSSDPN
jgi:signal transduction histidine kinase